jgi:hypothetical protein
VTIALLRPRIGLFLALAAVAAAFALPQRATAAAAEIVDRGVVQSVTSGSIVLRALDGATVEIAVGPATILRVNGRRATLTEIRPGHVAAVFHEPAAPARLVRAIGTSRLRTADGRITRVGRLVLIVRAADGETLRVRLGLRTRIRWADGRPAGRRALRIGRDVRVTHVPGRVAELIVVMRTRA